MGKQSRARRKASTSSRYLHQGRFYDRVVQYGRYPPHLMNSEVILANNVLNYVLSMKKKIDVFKDLTGIAPLFEKFFIEFKYGAEFGFHFSLFDTHEEPIDRMIVDDTGYSHIQGIKWEFHVIGFVEFKDDEGVHRINDYAVYVDKEGKLLEIINLSHELEHPYWRGRGKFSTVEEYLVVALYTFNFLNCRNVELVDHLPPPQLDTENRELDRLPLTQYKTLAIRRPSKRAQHESMGQEGHIPLHIRRGHFKTFTADAPRFGRHHPSNIGTFWVEATTVGERQSGIIVKDYDVKAEHEPHPKTS